MTQTTAAQQFTKDSENKHFQCRICKKGQTRLKRYFPYDQGKDRNSNQPMGIATMKDPT